MRVATGSLGNGGGFFFWLRLRDRSLKPRVLSLRLGAEGGAKIPPQVENVAAVDKTQKAPFSTDEASFFFCCSLLHPFMVTTTVRPFGRDHWK